MSVFRQLMMKRYRTKYYMNLDIVGSPTISSGVVSGFSASNYLNLSQPFVLNSTTKAEIVVKFNMSTTATNGIIATYNSYGMLFYADTNNKLKFFMGNGSSWTLINNVSGQTTLQNNTDYLFKIQIDNGLIKFLLSTDGITWNLENSRTLTLTEEYTYNLSLGIGRTSSSYFNGSIDINNSYIIIDGTKYNFQFTMPLTKVGNPTITDGVVSGFSDSDYLQSVNNMPNSDIRNYEFCFKTTITQLNNTVDCYLFTYHTSSRGGIRLTTANKIQWVISRVVGTSGDNSILSDIISLNDTLIIKCGHRGNNTDNDIFYMKISKDNGITWVEYTYKNDSELANVSTSHYFTIGGSQYFSTKRPYICGSIDIPNSYIIADGTKYIFTLP